MRRLLSRALVLVAAWAVTCGLLVACAAGGQQAAPDAEAIVSALKDVGLPIGNTVVFDQQTDPNGLLGTPDGYTSKVTFADTRIVQDDRRDSVDTPINMDFGGTLEVFSTEESCAARERDLAKDADSTGGAFGMYGYRVGCAYLRISSELSPTQAQEYAHRLLNVFHSDDLSKTMLATDELSDLERTGKSVGMFGCTFSVGEGWMVGRQLDILGGKQVWLSHGSDTSRYLTVIRLNVPLTDEGIDKAVRALANLDENAQRSEGVTADGVRLGTVSYVDASNKIATRVFYYPIASEDGSAVVLLCYNSDFKHAPAAADAFGKTIQFPEESREQVLEGWRQVDEDREAAGQEDEGQRESAEAEADAADAAGDAADAADEPAERDRQREESVAWFRERATLPAGTYKVGNGKDISAGEYKITPDSEGGGSYECCDSKGSLIRSGASFGACDYITLEEGQSIRLVHCSMITSSLAQPTKPAGPGVYKVGLDIRPGTYRLVTKGGRGRYCVYFDSECKRSVFYKGDVVDYAHVRVKQGQHLELRGAYIDQ